MATDFRWREVANTGEEVLFVQACCPPKASPWCHQAFTPPPIKESERPSWQKLQRDKQCACRTGQDRRSQKRVLVKGSQLRPRVGVGGEEVTPRLATSDLERRLEAISKLAVNERASWFIPDAPQPPSG
ncbi:hypothetical protein EYF80_023294 [Liparis tanakae]|uniref:Uncharacterized protein n=1 Tax=Liparis tanakae TaxID=230148 RepID=A0A4Z2HLU8_9TELE|nr:hypothetical protein EYF80_023294 [Liparis tanakae]